jgi:hypothetical protein
MEEVIGKTLTARNDDKKRWRRSTGIPVAVALSDVKVGVAWRSGVVEFRRLRKGGMWLLRTPRRLVREGFRKETYLGYVGEAEADSLLDLAPSSFRLRGENFMSQTEDQREGLKRYWVKILKKSAAWKLLRSKTALLCPGSQKTAWVISSCAGARSYPRLHSKIASMR